MYGTYREFKFSVGDFVMTLAGDNFLVGEVIKRKRQTYSGCNYLVKYDDDFDNWALEDELIACYHPDFEDKIKDRML